MPRDVDHTAYIAIGSNMDSPAENCLEAANLLNAHPAISISCQSSLYSTEPFGKTDQDWFVNSVIEAATLLTPEGLLKACLSIEKNMGRIRNQKWGPRIIDLDILFYDDLTIKEKGLVIPHPGITERSFVLVPMNEIAPDFIHPQLKKSIRSLLEEIKNPQQVNLLSSNN